MKMISYLADVVVLFYIVTHNSINFIGRIERLFRRKYWYVNLFLDIEITNCSSS